MCNMHTGRDAHHAHGGGPKSFAPLALSNRRRLAAGVPTASGGGRKQGLLQVGSGWTGRRISKAPIQRPLEVRLWSTGSGGHGAAARVGVLRLGLPSIDGHDPEQHRLHRRQLIAALVGEVVECQLSLERSRPSR